MKNIQLKITIILIIISSILLSGVSLINLYNFNKYYSKFRAFFYKLSHLFTRKKLKLKSEIPLMLPESIPSIDDLKNLSKK